MSTISDVARAAGVSVATVSRALRGVGQVNPATREKVLRVAAELEYVASPTASSLASGRTRVVAVVTPFLTRWFFAMLVSAIEKELGHQHHHALLVDLEADRSGERHPLTQEMLSKRVDGLVTLSLPLTDVELEMVDRLGLPLVSVGMPVRGWPCVGIDDREAMTTAMEHVITLGHQDIGYVGARTEPAARTLIPLDRRATFHDVMAQHRLAVRPEWVRATNWSAEGAAAEMADLLRSEDRPTAVVAASDEMAIGVVAEARRAGLRVPEDLSVIGIDDFALSGVLDVTTIRQDVAGQGRAAARLLMSAILHGASLTTRPDRLPPGGTDRAGRAPKDVLLPTELVIRNSTAPPAAGRRAESSR